MFLSRKESTRTSCAPAGSAPRTGDALTTTLGGLVETGVATSCASTTALSMSSGAGGADE
jgi:hypothetical protein